MDCPRGHGELIEGVVAICACDAKPPTKIENVPAYVCATCGERIFTRDTTRRLRELRAGGQLKRAEWMHVFDFGAVSASQGAITSDVTTVSAASPFLPTART
jgi:DNA-directed RNA polymerase subunit RPC12/RpoP